MTIEFIELAIDDFYEKKLYNEIKVIIYNGIYYYDISDFKKLKVTKHGKYKIFFNYVNNNKKDFKSLPLNKIISYKKPN